MVMVRERCLSDLHNKYQSFELMAGEWSNKIDPFNRLSQAVKFTTVLISWRLNINKNPYLTIFPSAPPARPFMSHPQMPDTHFAPAAIYSICNLLLFRSP